MHLITKENLTPMHNGIFVGIAGIVLLNNYIPMLFERLKLTCKYKFPDTQSQLQAANSLHYLVTGNTIGQQAQLPLIKVLCNLPLLEQIASFPTVPTQDQELMDDVLNAMMANWPAIGTCSIDGLRHNWLIRNGLLIEQTDNWELNVENRAYDVLISRSPFSFSIIKYPWMNNPLHVNWRC